MGQLSSGLGAAFNESGMPEVAVVQYERALKFYEQLQNTTAISYALYGLGRTYFLLGDLTQANNYLQQSLERAPDSLSKTLPLQYLGIIHLQRGEYNQALENLKSVLQKLHEGCKTTERRHRCKRYWHRCTSDREILQRENAIPGSVRDFEQSSLTA